MARHMQRREQLVEQLERLSGERPHETRVGIGVVAELAGGVVDRAAQQHRRLVIQRMRDRNRRTNPPEAMRRQRQGAEERRQHPHGMAAGTHVVRKAGQRQRRGARAAANLLARFQHPYRRALLCQRDGRGQAVGP
jgi:hypothetical protein